MLLGLTVQMGESPPRVARAGTGSGTSRAVLTGIPPVPLEDALRIRARARLAALGIARSQGPAHPVEPVDVGEVGDVAVVEGVRGQWRVDPARLDAPFTGRAALLSPFDLLLHDRKRMSDIFEFDYILEMFKPVASRRWGYYALPVLVGDRLVGKVDATADMKAGVLRVHAVHEDEPWSADARAAVDAEIDDLARWLDLDLVRDSSFWAWRGRNTAIAQDSPRQVTTATHPARDSRTPPGDHPGRSTTAGGSVRRTAVTLATVVATIISALTLAASPALATDPRSSPPSVTGTRCSPRTVLHWWAGSSSTPAPSASDGRQAVRTSRRPPPDLVVGAGPSSGTPRR